jgi:glycosyltransferase involved in cell wall biosynthesis
MKPAIAIILPAYNEELTIAEVIAGYHGQLPNAQIIVVDNNSTDATADVASAAFAALGVHGLVLHETRRGKGNAVRRAFLEIDADYYVMADADLTYPPEQLRSLLDPVLSGRADMTVGDRHTKGNYRQENKRRFHVLGNSIVRGLINRLFRARLADIMSGYRVFNRRFVRNYPILVEGFQLETDMTLHALDKRFRILEIPIDYRDRPPGSSSKLSTVKDGLRVLFTIFQIFRYYRPLLFFSAVALLLALAGLGAAIPVFRDWVQYRFIYHLPLAVLASVLELAAIMFFNIGLTLDAIGYQQRLAFEQSLLARDGRSHDGR